MNNAEHKIGCPKYKYEDLVEFKYSANNTNIVKTGVVYIVDAYGTFEQNEEPSYDIFVEGKDDESNILYKHIRESSIIKKIEP